ncbi:helix-turn-helix domain-containing protein [Clostridium gasigenes]|uniref:helix-turn-helix domain-containing protein n=1 Tax=Clostridium gasigenes TaxID=94869 RepID=UPI00162A9A2C|nr:helix-turn-helix domain-containing protein [Clostridium gasigenes]MBB6622260.1 helix-turn-helix domain-containing protein [Clostridium gasigenes]
MVNSMESIINRLKNRRIELDMSYQDLASKTGLSKSTLQRYETGSIKNMPLDKLGILASALNVNPIWLIGFDEKEKIPTTNSYDIISLKESKLISVFKQLNETGKDEAIKRVSELTEIIKYTQDEICASKMIAEEPAPYLFDSPTTVAAHDDNLTDAEKNIMDERIIEALKKL